MRKKKDHRKDNRNRPRRQWTPAELTALVAACSTVLTAVAAIIQALNK